MRDSEMNAFRRGWDCHNGGKSINVCVNTDEIAGWKAAADSGSTESVESAARSYFKRVLPETKRELKQEPDGDLLWA